MRPHYNLILFKIYDKPANHSIIFLLFGFVNAELTALITIKF